MKAAFSATPITIGRRNCEALTGMSWRFVLESDVPKAKVGREVIVRASDLLSWLDTHRAEVSATVERDESVDSVLADVGLRRA